MTSYDQLKQVKQEAVEFNRYSIRLWIVLSLVFLLASTVILSKRNLADHRWIYVSAVILPLSLALYFRNRIVQFGPVAYVAALLAMLAAAVLFGI